MSTPPKFDYDYIVTGGGCAGLSFIMRVLGEPSLRDKKILLIEKDGKSVNDRTWCFWEKGIGFFDDLIFKKWNHVWFHGDRYSALKTLRPYAYKMIRGIDFYRHCHEAIRSSRQVEVVREAVSDLKNIDGGVAVSTENSTYTGNYAFNSILFDQSALEKSRYYLLQHFKGWIVETEEPVFDPEKATLMDFRVDQSEGTTFVYVMPFSPTRALVEYTLFTRTLLDQQQYDQGLKDYISRFIGTDRYRIEEEEFGVIPMTDYAFKEGEGHIINMGTAGGQTKPSSGYAFRFIQKHVDGLVTNLKQDVHPLTPKTLVQKRFNWYDSVLLHMLYRKKMAGSRIFTLLFKRNKVKTIFRFLDNETNFLEELYLLNTLPQLPFMKAGVKEFIK